MRSRPLALGATLALASLAVALAVARSGGAPAGGVRPAPGDAPAAAATSPPPVAPEQLRDVFRFADEREASGPAMPEVLEVPAAPAEAAPLASGPRLVGLVRRSERLLAALALGGEVVLLGPGEAAGEVTVVAVGDDSVRIRRGDGSESTLELP